MQNGRVESYTLLRLVQPSSASGSAASEMGSANRSGQTGLVTKVTGKTTELTDKASSSTSMGMFMRETGSTIRRMDTVSTFM